MVLSEHYRQAAEQNGQAVVLHTRELGVAPRGNEEHTTIQEETVYAKVKGEQGVSTTDLDLLDIGKLPEDAKILMMEYHDVSKNDAVEIDGEMYEVFKTSDHYGQSGEIAGQRIMVKPE